MQKNEMAQRLATLKEREQKTRDSEIRLRAQQESVQQELDKALKEAEASFGTSDLNVLRENYRKAKEEDTRALSEYEQSLVLREQLIETINANVDKLRLS
jgi:Zn-dependent M16 (insulinase) family peptidase